MHSEHNEDWKLSLRKIINTHEKHQVDYSRERNRSYENINNNIHTEDLHKKRMKLFSSARKLYLFINRTKREHFSFQPKMLKVWTTITKKRNYFIKEIDEMVISELYNDKECKYLLLFKRTLEKYDSSYGLKIGLLLHRKFNRDVALVINEYLM